MRYPKQVTEVIHKLRSGKSKNSLAEAQELTWHFDWCVQVKGMTFAEVIAEAQDRQSNPKPEPTVDERLKEYAKSCHVCLRGSIGRWQGFSRKIPVPDEILVAQRAAYEKDEQERKRFQTLPKAEQDKEIVKLLGSEAAAGLFMIQVP